MHIETIQLWEDQQQVTLTAYVPYQVGDPSIIRPAIVICPGGSYLYTSDREAEPVALRFASLGYVTFVLHYNTYFGKAPIQEHNKQNPNPLVKYPQPLYDVAKAISVVRENAAKWGVNPDQITVAGFSAGGHLAASIGVHWNKPYVSEHIGVSAELIKPNSLILAYALLDSVLAVELMNEQEIEKYRDSIELMNYAVLGTIEQDNELFEKFSPANFVGEHTPPTFLWHTAEDDLVLSAHSLQFAMGLAKQRIPYELHVFEEGGHGLSLSDRTTATNDAQINTAASQWVQLADAWLQRRLK